MVTKSSSPKSGSFAATSVGGRVFFRLRRHQYGEIIDACDGMYTFHIEEGLPEQEFLRDFMPQPIIPDLDEIARRRPRQEFPMSEEAYENLRLARPDLWERCMFCRGKAYFLDPDYPPDRRLLESIGKRQTTKQERSLWDFMV